MDQYELEITAEDIGEIIEIVRVQHLKMHLAPFAAKLGMKESVILIAEEGKGPHGMKILKKMSEEFNRVKVTVNVQVS